MRLFDRPVSSLDTFEGRLYFYKGLHQHMSLPGKVPWNLYLYQHMGFCGMVRHYSDCGVLVYDDRDFKRILPELWAKKPDDKKHFWFPTSVQGRVARLDLLSELISEMESQLQAKS